MNLDLNFNSRGYPKGIKLRNIQQGGSVGNVWQTTTFYCWAKDEPTADGIVWESDELTIAGRDLTCHFWITEQELKDGVWFRCKIVDRILGMICESARGRTPGQFLGNPSFSWGPQPSPHPAVLTIIAGNVQSAFAMNWPDWTAHPSPF